MFDSLPVMHRRSQCCSSWQTGGDVESNSWLGNQSWASSVPGRWGSHRHSDHFSCCASSGSGCQTCWWWQSGPWGWSRRGLDCRGEVPGERRICLNHAISKRCPISFFTSVNLRFFHQHLLSYLLSVLSLLHRLLLGFVDSTERR